jgi:hypothetical protein
MDKVDGPDADKTEWIKLDFFMDPDNSASKYSRQFAIFKDEFLKEWMPMKEPTTRAGCFGHCRRVKPYTTLKIV